MAVRDLAESGSFNRSSDRLVGRRSRTPSGLTLLRGSDAAVCAMQQAPTLTGCEGQEVPSPSPKARICPLPSWRLRRVEDYIEAHLADPVGLADLAGAVGLSRMHFAAQFRIATGRSPHEHLMRRRIEHAQGMLRDQDTPLVEVALSLGFQSQSHFSTVFKRFTGSSPAVWRRAARSPQAWRLCS